MRRAVFVVLCLCVSTTGYVAARQTPQSAPTFRSGVALATIDVTVLDKDGKPVPGLTADDIEIKLNGKVQPIRALAYLQAAAQNAPGTVDKSAPAAAPSMPAPIAVPPADAPRRTLSNAGASSARTVMAPAPVTAPAPAESRVFVLLIDDLSYSPTRGKAMFLSASRFIDKIPASDPVGFATTSGVGAINPTRDRAALRIALSKVVGGFNDPRGVGKSGPSPDKGCSNTPDTPLGINEAIDVERGDDRLLTEIVIRECFNGDRSGLNHNAAVGPANSTFAGTGTSVAEMMSNCQCAHDVQTEARRVAALARQNKARQIAGITSVVDAMKTASGIRHLVLLTEGLPVSREVDDLTPLARAAGLAGVQLSVLLEEPDLSMTDEGKRGMDRSLTQTDTGSSRRRREDDQLLVNGAQTMTDMLGGTFYRVIGTPDPQFDRVLIASSAVYRLGVELPSGATPGKEFTVTASVKRPGIIAKANRFAVVAGAENPPAPAPFASKAVITDANGKPIDPSKIGTGSVMASSPDDVLKAALNSSVNTGDVPIRIAATARRSASAAGQVDVSVNVVMPSSVKGPITTFVGLVDATNAMRSSRRVLEPSTGADYAVSFLFPLAPGDYRIRFAASDSSGAIGTIDLPVRASLAPFGPYTSSDLLTWVVDSANKAQLFTIEDVPAADTLNASIELYANGATPPEPPSIKWTLLREGEGKPVAEDETPARTAGPFMRADVAFPFNALPAGVYTVRAELIQNDKVAGTRAAVVRKNK